MPSDGLSLAIFQPLPVVVTLNESTIGCEWSNSLAKPSSMSNFGEGGAKPQWHLGIPSNFTPPGGDGQASHKVRLSLFDSWAYECLDAFQCRS